jgi:hypothetical protein
MYTPKYTPNNVSLGPRAMSLIKHKPQTQSSAEAQFLLTTQLASTELLDLPSLLEMSDADGELVYATSA